ncbi:MAG: tetratricopeptide repeat protein [Flavobacteriales bacterium]|nr:tetratricopeptide repeat protein [Flavobacteriales bacterium]
MLLFLVAWSAPLQAQENTDEQLAAQYFRNGDFERAILYYERLFDKQPTPFYYEQLFKSYLALNELDKAEKLVKDRLKRSDDPRYTVDLGQVYELMGKPERSEQLYDRLLKDLPADMNAIRQVANAFVRVDDLDRAIACYERGQRLLRDNHGFHYEVAGLYGRKGDIDNMVRSYLELLDINEGYIQAVQNGFSRYIDFTVKDARSEVLRVELLRRIQKNPDRTIFHDLLIWMYVQQKDIDAAFVQAKALDKRFEEGGVRLLDLAEIAMNNEDPRSAVKCYDHIIALGRNDEIYVRARIGRLKAEHLRLTSMSEPSTEELEGLRDAYIHTLDELGRSSSTIALMNDQAELYANYLNDLEAAAQVLEQALELPGLSEEESGRLKLELGDVHLFRGDIWEASLLYSQVDLDFKYDALGHEARLRNAKVSFYAGDLLWCKAQLDVLKASTSKLIANDAMELSLLISDHIGPDSNSVPLNEYARADLLIFQRRFDEAVQVLDSLQLAYPIHDLGDDILYQRYRIAKARKDYKEAADHLEKVLELYPLGILVDNALFDLGVLYEEDLQDTERAKAMYERLLFEQTASIFVPEARARYRRLRGDVLEEEPAPHTHP